MESETVTLASIISHLLMLRKPRMFNTHNTANYTYIIRLFKHHYPPECDVLCVENHSLEVIPSTFNAPLQITPTITMIPSRFTKVLLSTLASALLPLALNAADTDGFKSLFNGKDLTGWSGNPDLWSVQDGVIVGQTTLEKPTKGNTFLIWNGGELKDFELHASFKLEGGNSGIQYRSKDLGNWTMAGYQCDIRTPVFDQKDPKNCLGKIYSEKEERGQMALGGEKVVYDRDGKKNVVGQVNEVEKLTKVLEQGEWKSVVIIARGNHFTHRVNGEIVCELADEDEAKRALSGHLGLQIHAGNPMKVSFKDIEIRELK